MREVRRYLDKVQAHVGRSLLAARGIEARVAADDEGGMAPHLSYVTGVRLLVQPEDFEAARRVLAEEQDQGAGGEDAIGDAWRVGAADGEESEGPRLRSVTGGRQDGEPLPPRRKPHETARLLPGGRRDDADDEAATLTRGSTSDPALVAYRAAVLGVFLFPVGLHLYSAWFAVRALRQKGGLSERARKQARTALAIDGVVIAFAIAFAVEWWLLVKAD